MFLRQTIAAVALLLASSAATVAQEPAMAQERAEQLLSVLGQAQQCVGLLTNTDAGDRVEETFQIAARELATAVMRGQVRINNVTELPTCLLPLFVHRVQPQPPETVDEAFNIGVAVGTAAAWCAQQQRDDLNEAYPQPAQMTQETLERWFANHAVQAEIWMRERGCSLVRLPG